MPARQWINYIYPSLHITGNWLHLAEEGIWQNITRILKYLYTLIYTPVCEIHPQEQSTGSVASLRASREQPVSCLQARALLVRGQGYSPPPDSGLALPLVSTERDAVAVLGWDEPRQSPIASVWFSWKPTTIQILTSQTLLECEEVQTEHLEWPRGLEPRHLGTRPSPPSGEGRPAKPHTQPPNHRNKSLFEAIYPFQILKFVLELMKYGRWK